MKKYQHRVRLGGDPRFPADTENPICLKGVISYEQGLSEARTGDLCYYFEELGILITGDLLFFRSVGRSDLPFGDGEALVRSLREKIYTLPGATLVYPGHGPETSVSFEAVHNHFCRA